MGIRNKIIWCSKVKEGLKLVEPSERLSETYIEESKKSLRRAEKDFEDKDFLWATVVLYYAEYYVLYSFLQKIGVKCENHSCSILAVSYLLGEEKTELINDHKEKRIDAQYYMRVGMEEEILKMLREAKFFVLEFEDFVVNLSKDEVRDYRRKLLEVFGEDGG